MRAWIVAALAAMAFGQAQAQVPAFLAPAQIPPNAPRPGSPGFIEWWTAHGPKNAPQGYHYETGSYVITPDDPCWLPAVVSPGSIAQANATVGKPDGVPMQIESMADPASIDQISLISGANIRLPDYGVSRISCHMTLNFVGRATASGILSIVNPGAYAPLQFSWLSDLKIAAEREKREGLRTAKKLLVKPDLTTPEVQVCVGRQTALGASEDFPGQLWAACSAKLKTASTTPAAP